MKQFNYKATYKVENPPLGFVGHAFPTKWFVLNILILLYFCPIDPELCQKACWSCALEWGVGDISRNKKTHTRQNIRRISHYSSPMKQFNYKVTWKVEHPPLGVFGSASPPKWNVPWKYNLFSHTTRSFGSGDLPIHVNIWSCLRKPLPGKIEKQKRQAGNMSPNTHFSKNVSASGQMIPTPYGSILHPPRGSGHGCHVTGGGGDGGEGCGVFRLLGTCFPEMLEKFKISSKNSKMPKVPK